MYRLMNRVFVRLLFQNDVFKQFDYWLRLDLDSKLIGEVQVEFVEHFVRRENVEIKDPKFWSWLKSAKACFYGNFGMGRVSFFT